MPEAATINTAPRMKGTRSTISNPHKEAEEELGGLAIFFEENCPVYARCMIEVVVFLCGGKG